MHAMDIGLGLARPPHQFRQLSNIRRDPPSLILCHEICRRPTSRFLLAVNVSERVAPVVLHDEARIVMVFDGPGRREAARGTSNSVALLPTY
jgi:hypothetical protein